MAQPSEHLSFVEVEIEIIKGKDLVGKDKNVVTRKKTSDPFINLYYGGKLIGKTKTIEKTLNPTWDETFKIKLGAEEANLILDNRRSGSTKAGLLEFEIFDKDTITKNDPMGYVQIPLKSVVLEEPKPKWYKVTKGTTDVASYCTNATGEIEVKITASGTKMRNLNRGETQKLVKGTVRVGLGWEIENGQKVDLDTSCVALDKAGEVIMEETVYYGNLANSNRSIRHSGDEKEGSENIAGTGFDEIIMVDLPKIPKTVCALYFVLTVATPGKFFEDVKSANVMVSNVETGTGLCSFKPPLQGKNSAMFLFRFSKDETGKAWYLTAIEGASATARDFGSLIPEIKSYSRDLVPFVKVDPNERIAVMRKENVIRVSDYSSGPRTSVPDKLVFGLSWNVTNGVNIDLDASAICLDSNLHPHDLVFFKQLRSNDGAIIHSGDEREGDKEGDDERFTIHLNEVDPSIKFIGMVVNSFSGQELDDIEGASCHLFDKEKGEKGGDIARYSMSNAKELDGHTALLVSCLFREKGEWFLRIIGQPCQGKVANELVSELQAYLGRTSPQPPAAMAEEDEIEVEEMPEAQVVEVEKKKELVFSMQNLSISA